MHWLFGKIFIPFGYFDHQIHGPVRDTLTSQAGVRRDPAWATEPYAISKNSWCYSKTIIRDESVDHAVIVHVT